MTRRLALWIAVLLAGCGGSGERSLCAGREATESALRIAPAGEPGEPMVITGTVWVGARRLPVPGTRLVAYHTNAAGKYARDGSGYPGAYLCGALITDEDGAYRIETIRPGARSADVTPHVHFDGKAPWGQRFYEAVGFASDYGLPAGESWEEVRPERRDANGVLHVERDFWIRY